MDRRKFIKDILSGIFLGSVMYGSSKAETREVERTHSVSDPEAYPDIDLSGYDIDSGGYSGSLGELEPENYRSFDTLSEFDL